MKGERPAEFWLACLLVLSVATRALLAATICLGNDEAYYYTYALYPALSHFDHPPMVGWVIQLFTLNLHLSSEFFIRLGGIVAGTINTYLIYLIASRLGNKRSGLGAAILYTASLYGFIITGTMMMPDAPQSVFWLAALLLLLKVLPGDAALPKNRNRLLLAAILTGFAMLSKYTSVFLWLGAVAYIVIFNRKWLKIKEFWITPLLILLIFAPVIIWNAQNNFVSFTFHSSRVEVAGGKMQWNNVLTEIGGELLYNNPVNMAVIIIAIMAFFGKRKSDFQPGIKLLLLTALPLVALFIAVSLFRPTLPHWNGMGFITLLPVAAVWLETRSYRKLVLAATLAVQIIILALASGQIATGFIPVDKILPVKNSRNFTNDLSLQIYGWRQLKAQVAPVFKHYESNGLMPADAPIVSYRWFPAANQSYYIARGTLHPVMAAGDTSEIHKYTWINRQLGGFRLNSDAWYITSDLDYKHPAAMQALYYEKIMPPDTITIFRMKKPVYNFYVYRLKNLQAKRVMQ